mmetsp:Transcript_9156/g.27556  ORF Transcript_9156/g.27556 Transcript_9156/m.27556 type:complete len:97 (-) Transcript_9156:552-842(-)
MLLYTHGKTCPPFYVVVTNPSTRCDRDTQKDGRGEFLDVERKARENGGEGKMGLDRSSVQLKRLCSLRTETGAWTSSSNRLPRAKLYKAVHVARPI